MSLDFLTLWEMYGISQTFPSYISLSTSVKCTKFVTAPQAKKSIRNKSSDHDAYKMFVQREWTFRIHNVLHNAIRSFVPIPKRDHRLLLCSTSPPNLKDQFRNSLPIYIVFIIFYKISINVISYSPHVLIICGHRVSY